MLFTDFPDRIGRKHHLFLDPYHIIPVSHDPEKFLFSHGQNIYGSTRDRIMNLGGCSDTADFICFYKSDVPAPNSQASALGQFRFITLPFQFLTSSLRFNYGIYRSVSFLPESIWNIKIPFLFKKSAHTDCAFLSFY